jgi:hypothetical protein
LDPSVAVEAICKGATRTGTVPEPVAAWDRVRVLPTIAVMMVPAGMALLAV